MKIDPNKGNREWKVNPKKNTVTIYKVTKKGLIRHEIPKGHPDLDKIYGGSAKHLRNQSNFIREAQSLWMSQNEVL